MRRIVLTIAAGDTTCGECRYATETHDCPLGTHADDSWYRLPEDMRHPECVVSELDEPACQSCGGRDVCACPPGEHCPGTVAP